MMNDFNSDLEKLKYSLCSTPEIDPGYELREEGHREERHTKEGPRRRGPKGGVLKEGKGAQKGIISRSKLTRPSRLGHTDKNCKWRNRLSNQAASISLFSSSRNH